MEQASVSILLDKGPKLDYFEADHVDILVNNAKVEHVKSIPDITPAHFLFVYNLNIRTPLLML